jgi:acyl-CoA thioesterase-2
VSGDAPAGPRTFADQLEPRALDASRCEGACREASPGRAFGGHVFALAVRAAQRAVTDDRSIHHARGVFLRPAAPHAPIVYSITGSSDTRRFSRREVVGEQNGKRLIELSASFAQPRDGPDFQSTMPEVEGPDALNAERSDPVEVRPVEAAAIHEARLRDPKRQQFWMRVREPLPDDPTLHAAAIAYMSDLQLLWLCLSANGLDVARRHETASVEHSLWFHRAARADDWLLFDQQCLSTSYGLGVVQGCLYARDGRLAASVVTTGTLPAP